MKQFFYIFIAFNLICQALPAQDLIQKKYIAYNTTITDVLGKSHKGFIATIDDTAIFISKTKFALTFENLDLSGLEKFGYARIAKVDLKSRASVTKGVLIGGISGILVGAIVGYSSVKRTGPNNLENLFEPVVTPLQGSLIGAAIGAGFGSLVGAILGHSKKVFKIKGKKDNLFEMKETMIKTLY